MQFLTALLYIEKDVGPAQANENAVTKWELSTEVCFSSSVAFPPSIFWGIVQMCIYDSTGFVTEYNCDVQMMYYSESNTVLLDLHLV